MNAESKRFSDYDAFAWIYNKHWGYFGRRVVPILERLVLNDLPAGAHILDLCCGTGQLAQGLLEKGYRVTGLDGSEEMLAIARENAPGARFIAGDARTFFLPDMCHAVFCTFDSLNHVMTLGELTAVFCNVYAVLQPGGVFEFDLNMEEGYLTRWVGSFAQVEDDHACIARSSHHLEERIGQIDITIFRRFEDRWERSDLKLLQRWYSEQNVRSSLQKAGFEQILVYDGGQDFGEELSKHPGRAFFVCRKSEEAQRNGEGRSDEDA